MGSVSIESMKQFLSRSISSLNLNKLRGLLAEIDFRNYLSSLGFADRVSLGGWIVRSEGAGTFGHDTAVFFPEIIQPGVDYPADRQFPIPDIGLHTICATFHQIGIKSYYCASKIIMEDNTDSIDWSAIQLGLPTQQNYQDFPTCLTEFNSRQRNYNFLRYDTDVSPIPQNSIPETFSKEHLRVAFQNKFLSEISDLDGIIWGRQFTYPIEIKEKTSASDSRLGDFFGLDVGPFVKLAFYAARRGNLHSIFIVREIDNIEERNLVEWRYITFEILAQFASWNPQAGGRSMQGTASTVVKIPKSEFRILNRENLSAL